MPVQIPGSGASYPENIQAPSPGDNGVAASIQLLVSQLADRTEWLRGYVAQRSAQLAMINWTSRNAGGSVDLNDSAYGSSAWVAVGASGEIRRSTNLHDWANPSSGTSNILRGVTYGGGLFVAVGASGTILTSPTGATWTSRTSGVTQTLWSVTHGDGLFVAVGLDGKIVTSPDGETWTERTSGTSNHLRAVGYGDGLYVAAGDAAVIVTSPDGVTWTERSGASGNIDHVAYGGGQWRVAGSSGLWGSSDGVAWAEDVGSPASTWVAYVGGYWVAGGTSLRIRHESTADWSAPVPLALGAAGLGIPSVRYLGGHLVGVGASGRLATSLRIVP